MIILRKIGGKLTPLFRRNGIRGGGAATGESALTAPIAGIAFHPLILLAVAIAFLLAWAFSHPAGLHAASVAHAPLSLAFPAVIGKVREMKEARAKVIADARTILDKADVEKRELTAEERTQYDKHLEEEGRQAAAIQREERQIELERSLAGESIPAEQRSENRGTPAKPVDARSAALASPEYRELYSRFLLEGRDAFTNASEPERRALEATGGPAGGFLQAPIEFTKELIKFLDNLTFVRQRATKLPVTVAKALGAASLDNDPADADWTSEIATGSEDSSMSFGNREMVPHPSAKLIKISNKLLRVTAGGAEQLVRERLAYKFGITEEKAFLTGSGVNQPLGVFTASTSGIDTSRDISAGNTATAVTFDGLLAAKYALKAQYMAKAAWAFSRPLVLQISQIKDTMGQYIWKQSVREGEPDTVLGLPFFMSEYVPSTFTTGKYVGVIGDWSNYWIADAISLEIQRLVELYAATNQTGFIGRMELDAQPVLAEAFARVKLG